MKRITGWFFGQVLGTAFMAVGGYVGIKNIAEDYRMQNERPVLTKNNQSPGRDGMNGVEGLTFALGGLALLGYSSVRESKTRNSSYQPSEEDRKERDTL